MAAVTFMIPGNPAIGVSIREVNGGLLFELTQSGDAVADLRGLFFDVTDPALLDSLQVYGEDVTDSAFAGNGVSNLGGGANMQGEGGAPYDVGVEIGSQGIGKNDIRTTSFTLSSTDGDLTLDLLSGVDIGVRLMSVGVEGGSRSGSEKNVATVPAVVADPAEDEPETPDVGDEGNDDVVGGGDVAAGDDVLPDEAGDRPVPADDEPGESAEDEEEETGEAPSGEQDAPVGGDETPAGDDAPVADEEEPADDTDEPAPGADEPAGDDDAVGGDAPAAEPATVIADGNDTIQGLGGDDRIYGNGDRGRVTFGADGRPDITVGDSLFGNDGADTFVYQAGDGVDQVWDFKRVEGDRIEFQGLTREEVAVLDFDLGDGYSRQGLFIDSNGNGRFDDGAIVFKDPVLIDDSFFEQHVTFTAEIDAPPAGPGVATGTEGDDFFAGEADSDDRYAGGAGDDQLYGNGGNDVLDGGAGNDRVDSTQGASTLIGGSGDDVMEASDEGDVIWGGAGRSENEGQTPSPDMPPVAEMPVAGPPALVEDAPVGDPAVVADAGENMGGDTPVPEAAAGGLAATLVQSWGTGYIAQVTIDAAAVNGGQGFATWSAQLDLGGEGQVVAGWSNDLNAPLGFEADTGTFSNEGLWHHPVEAGDSFTLTYQVEGGDFADDMLDFGVTGAPAVTGDTLVTSIELTDFGDSVLGRIEITNTGSETVDDWLLDLGLLNGVGLSGITAWGGTATPGADGFTLQAADWSAVIAPGQAIHAGFTATDLGGHDTVVSVDMFDFV